MVESGHLVQESDFSNVPFLGAIIRETFRLHIDVPLLLPCCSNQPYVVVGCKFLLNTRLISNIFVIYRDPTMNKNPNAFILNTFLELLEVNALSSHDFY